MFGKKIKSKDIPQEASRVVEEDVEEHIGG
jgi:hypothetical protein